MREGKGIENKKVCLMVFLTELIYFCKRTLDLLRCTLEMDGHCWEN